MNLDKKTESLNKSGAFLQIHVLNELTKRMWGTEIESPRTISPFVADPKDQRHILYKQDPNRLLAEKFPEAINASQNTSSRQETSLDIYAGKFFHLVSEEYDLRFCIEVKKNDPRYSDWCFFQLEQKREKMRTITNCIRSIGDVDLLRVGETTRYGNEVFLQITKFPHWHFLEHDVSDFAVALRNKDIDNEFFKSEKTKIDEGLRQIIKGTYGTVIEHITHQIVTGEGYDNRPTVFIPIIVTNANLFLCKFDPNDIDPESGQIKKDPQYVEKDILIYEYPTPKEVQFPEPLKGNLDPLRRRQILKWQVLIATPKGFVGLLDDIEKFFSFIRFS